MANERCASTAIMPLLLIKPLYSNQSTVHDDEIRWAIDSASSVRKPRASEHRCRKAIERLLCGAPTVSNFFCRFVMPQNEPIRLESVHSSQNCYVSIVRRSICCITKVVYSYTLTHTQ